MSCRINDILIVFFVLKSYSHTSGKIINRSRNDDKMSVAVLFPFLCHITGKKETRYLKKKMFQFS